jgi:hypothetical protein
MVSDTSIVCPALVSRLSRGVQSLALTQAPGRSFPRDAVGWKELRRRPSDHV